VTYRCL